MSSRRNPGAAASNPERLSGLRIRRPTSRRRVKLPGVVPLRSVGSSERRLGPHGRLQSGGSPLVTRPKGHRIESCRARFADSLWRVRPAARRAPRSAAARSATARPQRPRVSPAKIPSSHSEFISRRMSSVRASSATQSGSPRRPMSPGRADTHPAASPTERSKTCSSA